MGTTTVSLLYQPLVLGIVSNLSYSVDYLNPQTFSLSRDYKDTPPLYHR